MSNNRNNTLEKLYLDHRKLVYAFISDYSNEEDVMEEIASTVWMKVWEKEDFFLDMDKKGVKYYLRAMVKTAASDYFRSLDGSLVRFGPFRDIIVVRILIKVIQAIVNVLVGIIFKATGNVIMEIYPILPVQKENTNTYQIGNILIKVCMIQRPELFGGFLFLADHFLQKMPGILGSVTVGMDTGRFNIIQELVNKGFAKIPHGSF